MLLIHIHWQRWCSGYHVGLAHNGPDFDSHAWTQFLRCRFQPLHHLTKDLKEFCGPSLNQSAESKSAIKKLKAITAD